MHFLKKMQFHKLQKIPKYTGGQLPLSTSQYSCTSTYAAIVQRSGRDCSLDSASSDAYNADGAHLGL